MTRTWFAVAVLLAMALAWYLSFSASRLDRLHHRVEGARATLDAQLVRRAEAAVELATSGRLDPASALLVAGAAADALAAGEHEGPGESPRSRERGQAESDLTAALTAALDLDAIDIAELDHGASASPAGSQGELLDRLASAANRVRLARRFHNQAVSDAQRVRRKRVVRWFHLAGRAELPQTFEMDDEVPSLSGLGPPRRGQDVDRGGELDRR
jgi:hypothetical protein